MAKFILAAFIGMVLALNLYGIVNVIFDQDLQELEAENKGYRIVYME